MKPKEERPKLLGYYIRPNRKNPTKGRVFDKWYISPCLVQVRHGADDNGQLRRYRCGQHTHGGTLPKGLYRRDS